MKPIYFAFLLIAYTTTALALINNESQTWVSPNGKYAVKEAFYGEGKWVNGIFENLATGRITKIYPPKSYHSETGGTRSIATLWSPNSHYLTLSTDRSKYCGDACLYTVEHGRISEIKLPPNMAAVNYLSDNAKKNFGHLSFEGMHALRWLDNSSVEIVSETEAVEVNGNGVDDVSEHFIIGISHGEGRIIKSFAEAQDSNSTKAMPSPTPAPFLLKSLTSPATP